MAGAAAVVLVALPAVMATVVTREVLTPSAPPAGMQASPAGVSGAVPPAPTSEDPAVSHFLIHHDGRAQVIQQCDTRDRQGPECDAAEEANRLFVQWGIAKNNATYRQRMAEICAREPGEPKPALLCE